MGRQEGAILSKALQIIQKFGFRFYFKCNGKLIFPILGNGIIINPQNLKFFWLFPFSSNSLPFIFDPSTNFTCFISEINLKYISSSSANLSTNPHHLVPSNWFFHFPIFPVQSLLFTAVRINQTRSCSYVKFFSGLPPQNKPQISHSLWSIKQTLIIATLILTWEYTH